MRQHGGLLAPRGRLPSFQVPSLQIANALPSAAALTDSIDSIRRSISKASLTSHLVLPATSSRGPSSRASANKVAPERVAQSSAIALTDPDGPLMKTPRWNDPPNIVATKFGAYLLLRTDATRGGSPDQPAQVVTNRDTAEDARDRSLKELLSVAQEHGFRVYFARRPASAGEPMRFKLVGQ